MSEATVPQNVEAEDKLLGPFSFRQFVYLLIAAACGFIIYFLAQAFWPLIFIPLPIAILAIVLALPFRRDQPTETYLMAVVRFIFKPKRRLWIPEGNTSNIIIDAPKEEDTIPTKNISGEELSNRISFLSAVLDTQGWSTRGVAMPAPDPVNNNIDVVEVQRETAQTDLTHDIFNPHYPNVPVQTATSVAGPTNGTIGGK